MNVSLCILDEQQFQVESSIRWLYIRALDEPEDCYSGANNHFRTLYAFSESKSRLSPQGFT